MGNKKSTYRQPVIEDEEKEKEKPVINLVNDNDITFSKIFVKKRGNFQCTRIKTWKKAIWFYDPLKNFLFKTGYVESFHDEDLTADIRVGYDLYRVPLWKVFMKVTEERPSPKEWKERIDLVEFGSTHMDVVKYKLKF